MATKRPYVPRTTGSAPKQHVDADRLIVGAGLDDTASNEALDVTATASAVNHIVLTNAAAGNDPDISATGDDTDVDLVLGGNNKGAGVVRLGVELDCNSKALTNVATINGGAPVDVNLTGTEDVNHLAKFNASGELIDFEIGDLTLKGTPTTSDHLVIADAAAAGALKKAAWPSGGAGTPHAMYKVQIAQGTWSNMPAALTLWRSQTYAAPGRIDLSVPSYTQCRIHCYVATAGTTGATIYVRYSDDGGSTWYYMNEQDSAGTAPSIDIGSTGYKASAWITFDAAASADVLLAGWGVNGNGADDPQVAEFAIEFK